MSVDEDLRIGAADVIFLTGVDRELVKPDGTGSRTVRLASFTTADEIIVNAYGVDAITGYSLAVDPLPEKFDRLTKTGEPDMVIHDVQQYAPNGILIALKYVLKQ